MTSNPLPTDIEPAATPGVAVLTGAGSGIGAAAAHRLARAGWKVVLAGIPADGLKDRAEAIEREGGHAFAVPTDVTRADAVAELFDCAAERFGRVNFAFANAGVLFHQRDFELHSMDDDAWDQTHAVNTRGVYLTCKHALRHFLATDADGDAGNRGSLVLTASIAGLTGASANPAYTTAKHAVIGLGRHIATHYGPRGIRCNVLCPGALTTLPNQDEHPDLADRARHRLGRIPMGRMGTADEIAGWVTFLASPDASYANGAVISVDGGFASG